MTEVVENTPAQDPGPLVKRNKTRWIKVSLILTLATIAGCSQYRYVKHVFDSTFQFSALSTTERHMCLRTEMGFYYWFYKTVVEGDDLFTSAMQLMYNKMVEFPNEVNSFNRFNIYPEVILASFYRYFLPSFNGTKECHTVDRGHDATTVESCVGMGEPIFFYLEAIWVLAGVTMATIFLYGTLLSTTVFGGLASSLQYFANIFNATRVYSTPNERENFAQPLLTLQMMLLTVQLRRRADSKTYLALQLTICLLNCLCLVFWQFSQFILLTQLAIVYVMHQVYILDTRFYAVILHSHFCGFHMAILLLQGNDMLKTSLYASFFVTVALQCLFVNNPRPKVRDNKDFVKRSVKITFRIIATVVTTVIVKKCLSVILDKKDDGHVWDILMSKLTGRVNFHSQQYLCSLDYHFMSYEDISSLSESFLIPLTAISTVYQIKSWFDGSKPVIVLRKIDKRQLKSSDEESTTDSEENSSGDENKDKRETKHWIVKLVMQSNVNAAEFYNIAQMVVFGVLAVLVMRLKLLFVPHMCVVSAPIMNYMGRNRKIFYKWAIRLLVITGSFLVIVLKVLPTNVYGTFRDIPQEEVLMYLKYNTPPESVVAASMPLSATVLLVAGRAIVNHPHYENEGARARTYSVYKMYGRFSSEDLYRELVQYKVTHMVLELSHCYGKSSRSCTYEGIWDAEVPALRGGIRLCDLLRRRPTEHFYMAYQNEQYAVFKIHDYSVKYHPRTMDT